MIIAWLYYFFHLLAHVMRMSHDPFVYIVHLQNLQFLLFLPLFACTLYTFAIFITLHVYAG